MQMKNGMALDGIGRWESQNAILYVHVFWMTSAVWSRRIPFWASILVLGKHLDNWYLQVAYSRSILYPSDWSQVNTFAGAAGPYIWWSSRSSWLTSIKTPPKFVPSNVIDISWTAAAVTGYQIDHVSILLLIDQEIKMIPTGTFALDLKSEDIVSIPGWSYVSV